MGSRRSGRSYGGPEWRAEVRFGIVGDDKRRNCVSKFLAMLALKRGRRVSGVTGRLTVVRGGKDGCRFAEKIAIDEGGHVVAAVEARRLDSGDEEGAPLDGGDMVGREKRFAGERGGRPARMARQSRE